MAEYTELVDIAAGCARAAGGAERSHCKTSLREAPGSCGAAPVPAGERGVENPHGMSRLYGAEAQRGARDESLRSVRR